MATISMSLQDIRDFVRAALDTDNVDLPDSLLDRYILDGSDRIDSYSDAWSFRAVDYTFSTVIGTQSYDIRSASRVSGITYPILRITDVRGPNWSLKPIDHQRMRKNYRASTSITGNPYAWSVWGDSIYLWSKPSSVQSISITGYRQSIDWVGTATAPDFPRDFHELIAWWALNRGHAREGDPQMAQFYRDEFAATLKVRAAKWIEAADAQPLVMNENRTPEQWRAQNGLGPLVYTWE